MIALSAGAVVLLALGAWLLFQYLDPEGEHGHKEGAHGGMIVAIGRDHYHAELILTDDGTMKLYMLGQEDTQVADVKIQELEGYARATDQAQSKQLEFIPEPQPGDREGRTSLFIGKLPDELIGTQMVVMVPSIQIEGQRYRFSFTTPAAEHGTKMPTKLASTKERDLYLTAGGKYTAADIKANKSQTASQKFASFQSKHNMHPEVGDKICPITKTKANPECTWIVGGQEYQFCCPPCVDEFVKLAKSDSDEILPAGEYVKR